MEKNELSANAKGGTELLMERLHSTLPPDLLDRFQIIPSRVRDLKEDKVRIFYAHDLPGDPEADAAVGNGNWRRFHRLVFVSNHQMQGYINRYDIPWSKCVVIPNSIVPFQERAQKPTGPIRLIYTPTPHRGLEILVPVFEKLAETHDIELDVFSSFKLYGWENRDGAYTKLFERMDAHPKIRNHYTQPNEVVREALVNSHIFAYPSIWHETSCLCLIEAMAAGLFCVHSNFGALYETAGHWTHMYQYHEDMTAHAHRFFFYLKAAVEMVAEDQLWQRTAMQADYANSFHSWNTHSIHWQGMLESWKDAGTSLVSPNTHFTYSAKK